jgi:hypothetical protein
MTRKYINEPYRIQLESPQSTLTICIHIIHLQFKISPIHKNYEKASNFLENS